MTRGSTRPQTTRRRMIAGTAPAAAAPGDPAIGKAEGSTFVLENNVSLPPRDRDELRALCAELRKAVEDVNRCHANYYRADDEDEDELRYWDDKLDEAYERRNKLSRAFKDFAARHEIGIAVLDGRLYGGFLADMGEADDPVQHCRALKLDRVVVLG